MNNELLKLSLISWFQEIQTGIERYPGI